MSDKPIEPESSAANTRQRHYVRRRGRTTQGQARALEECAHRALLLGEAAPEAVFAQPPRWPEVFAAHILHKTQNNSESKVTAQPDALRIGVEIGFGMGQALIQWGQQEPDVALVGIEVYQPGIGSLLLQAQQENLLDRLFVLEGDARTTLDLAFAPASLGEVRIFFPDPWHKARHNKRRLVQREFLELVVTRLAPGGVLRMATDWEDYANWMLAEAEATPGLHNVAGPGEFAPRFAQRDVTRFEARGHRLGHGVWDLHYTATAI